MMAMFPSIKWLVLNVTAVKMTFPITLWSTMMLIPGKGQRRTTSLSCVVVSHIHCLPSTQWRMAGDRSVTCVCRVAVTFEKL